jgi:Flp pilus assembly protein TadD
VNELIAPAKPRAMGVLSRLHFYLQKQWIRCVLLGLIGFAVRIPALSGEPLWDDDYLVRTNPFIKSPILILEVFRHYLFPESYSSHYRPVQNISYMADYLLWGDTFYGFHLSNVLLHVAAGVILYLLLRRLFARLLRTAEPGREEDGIRDPRSAISWAAFFVALLWMVHPVHSAAIDYVSGRADSLAVFLGGSAWLLFFRAGELRGRYFRALLFSLAWVVGLLALCSRESACLWPILFLVYLFAFDRPATHWKGLALIGACLVLFATYYGLRQLPNERPGGSPSSEWSPAVRSILMLRALGDYGRLLVFPSNLHMERGVYSPSALQNETARHNAIEFEYLSIAGLAFFIALVLLALRRGQGQRLRIFGAAWFILAYLPISNLIELNATVAEHWLYLPSVGFLMFMAGCALDLSVKYRRATIAFACAAVLALGTRSVVRSGNWVSNEIFARHTIRSGGLTIRIALMLGQVYSNREDYVEAEKILRKALELCPEYPLARNNLAHALLHLGREKEAETLFAESAKAASETRKDYPRTWVAALNFAHARYGDKDPTGAVAILDKARPDYPETWELIGAESEMLREMDQLGRALEIVRPYAQANHWHYAAWMTMGRILAQRGDVEDSLAALRHASWLDIHETAALNLIAFVKMGQNRLGEACQVQRRAVARQPDQPKQYLLLSNILDKMGRGDEARAALAEVSRLRALAGSEKPTDKLVN